MRQTQLYAATPKAKRSTRTDVQVPPCICDLGREELVLVVLAVLEQSTDRQGNLLLLVVDVDDLRLDNLADLESVFRLSDAVISDLGTEYEEEAKSILIEHNLRLGVYIARRFENTGINIEDLISIGTIGLIKAVDTFDPDKGKKFASYASRCIENELRMELRRTRRAGPQLSLQEPLEAGGQLTLADTLPDVTDMEADCEQRADAARLRSMVEQLPGRERQIMRLRYGFGGAAQTQQQTAQTLHISRSYVSRLEKRALKLLRDRWKESS